MRYNVLFVDDEEQILKSYKRVLRGKDNFSVYTANGAQEGLSNISSKDREYQIIVSDYKMPDMNGVDFLNKAKQYSPNSIKVMLTGEADLKATMSAINEIGIFKLLLKPCQTEDLISILNQCIKQYELVISEKVLLQKTLSGTVNMLTDMLSILRPDVFSIAIIQKERAKHIACKIGLESIS